MRFLSLEAYSMDNPETPNQAQDHIHRIPHLHTLLAIPRGE